jgi:hypothetical protein
MQIITGKHISRRTVLAGMGATVGLPFLDAMVPAGRPWARTEAGAAAAKTRLICIEMSHGSAGSNAWGASQNMWAPAAVGSSFDLTPSALLPLEPYRDYLTIVSETDCKMAEAFSPKEIGGDHFRSTAVFLTQSHCKQTQGSDVHAGPSLDQLYAQRFGQDTPIPSMQLCIENINQSGGCAYGYTCVYTDSLSWASPNEPLPVIRDPRVAFEQLFGGGGTPEERAARRRTDRSILDWITDRVAQLRGKLGPADRSRLDQYLDNVREIERRIEKVEAHNVSGEVRELPAAPTGVPDSFEEHVRLMFDLQVLAFASDLTRVFSFKMSRDSSARVFPESGVNRPFHPCSHHGGRERGVTDFYNINKYHISMIPYLLEKLKNTVDGDTHLLDKTLIIYGSAMGDSNLHNHKRCPFFAAGGANGQLQGNRHLRAAPGTPMANVMLSLLHKLGLDDLESFGDSTAPFAI